MSPGDRVRYRTSGVIGTVLEVDGDSLLVEVGEGDRRTWTRGSTRVVQHTFAPRGRAKVNERMLAAARLVAEGKSRAEVAALYGVQRGTVQQWLDQVREALEEARHLAADQLRGPT